MKKVLVLQILAVALLAGACGDDVDKHPVTPPPTDPRPSVRFFNAMTGMTSGGFTTNAQFVAGSALTFGQSTEPCAKLDAGLTTFAFGAANTGGTSLSGNVLATLPNQTLANGSNFTVAAIGHGVHSILYMLDNNFSGTLGNAATLNLQSGTVNTVAIVHNGAMGSGFRLIPLPRCSQ